MPTYDKSTIDEIARLRDFAINELKYGSSDSTTEEIINIEEIDRNTIWEISERAYRYSDKFYYSRLDASPREPHFFDFFLKELTKLSEFKNLVYEASFSKKLISVREEIETSHIEQMENVSETHEEEKESIEQRHEEEKESIEQRHEEEIESIEQKHEGEIESIEQRHEEEIEELEKFEAWIEDKEFTPSQIKYLTSVFELHEEGIIEVSDLLGILNKIHDSKSD